MIVYVGSLLKALGLHSRGGRSAEQSNQTLHSLDLTAIFCLLTLKELLAHFHVYYPMKSKSVKSEILAGGPAILHMR